MISSETRYIEMVDVSRMKKEKKKNNEKKETRIQLALLEDNGEIIF